MKAIVFHSYSAPEFLNCEEVETPAPAEDEVLIRVQAASVNPFDWHLLRGWPYIARIAFGLRGPKTTRLGVDVAGRVEAVGAKVTRLNRGDDVFGTCNGSFAEYACAPESAVAVKPAKATFEQAASAPLAALTALQALRDRGRVAPGWKVLVNGAAGGCGTFAVQIGRSLGADITGVCSSRNVEMVRSIGAQRVIDYTQEDFTASAARFDLMVDCVGNRSLSACRRVLNPGGCYVMIGGPSGRWVAPVPRLLRMLAISPFVRQKLLMVHTRRHREDLDLIRGLMESGRVTPVIDRRFGLDEVPEAIRYLEQGHARGKVVIVVQDPANSRL